MWKRALTHLAISLFALLLWQEAMYISNEPVPVAWTRGSEGTTPEVYEVVAVWEGPLGTRAEYPVGETSETSIIVERPRSGVFHIKVRAKNPDTQEVSEWSLSTDPAHAEVDGLPRGWRILFEVPPPSGGGIS